MVAPGGVGGWKNPQPSGCRGEALGWVCHTLTKLSTVWLVLLVSGREECTDREAV